ncbi:hypothetical protein G9C85_16860 [Halorubellus sp. JP-L1]|uniref:DUF7344 domain-containing protein n=1 Tax=Halorubellus sp. JP-L1 TaxID=2715753 RepID=UPI00140B23FB|nr:hypothetical protein [Halorubellus sp. JP-L1]NHN43290.1 hypothetical protein [Halorubellus sp. JP-L1]
METERDEDDDVVSTRRQTILGLLTAYDGPVHLDTLATDLAANEEFVDDDTTDERVHTLRITLHHRHLPKMDDRGILDYHPDSHRVELDAR